MRATVTVEYFDSKQPDQVLFEWKTQDLRYDGTLFDVNVHNVLNDGVTLVANTHTNDTYYGFGIESVTFNASTPIGATTYKNAIGFSQRLRETTEPWSFHLFKRKTYHIVIE